MKLSRSVVFAVVAMAVANPSSSTQISPQITNNCIGVDMMAISLVMNLSHLTAQFVGKFVSQLTGTIEETISTIANGADESPVMAHALTPFVAAVSKASGYLVSSLASNPTRLISHSDAQSFSNSLQKVAKIANAHNVNTQELNAVVNQLKAL